MIDLRFLLATNVKDELNIHEWILYHIYQGWDHILIYDDFSDPIKYPVTCPLHVMSNVTIEKRHQTKGTYMRLAIQFGKDNDYDYLFYIDVDEYIVLPLSTPFLKDWFITMKLNKTLQETYKLPQHPIATYSIPSSYIPWKCSHLQMKYRSWPQAIHIPWLHFGSNHLTESPSSSSLITIYTKSDVEFHQTVKWMVRISDVKNVINPHCYSLKQYITGEHVHVTTNGDLTFVRGARYPTQQQIKKKEDQSSVFLAHYSYQSWNEFCRRRSRPRDDTQQRREFSFDLDTSKPPPDIFHQYSNSIKNPQVLSLWNMYQISKAPV